MKVILLSFLNSRLSTSLSYMHKLSLDQGIFDSYYLHFPISQAGVFSKTEKEALVSFCRDADFVGISLMTSYFDIARQATQLLRNETGSTIIWGGVHTQLAPLECLKHSDLIFLGEADNQEYLDFFKKPQITDFMVDAEYFQDPTSPKRYLLTPDLEVLPSITFDEPNFFIYDNNQFHHMPDSPDIRRKYVGDNHMIISSRGCPYSCSYCCNHVFKKNNKDYAKIRKISIEKLIGDAGRFIQKNDHIREIHIGDDDFVTRSVAEFEVFNRLWKKEIKLPFNMLATPMDIKSNDKLHLLIDAGMMEIQIGIQAGSETVRRKLYHRPETNQQVEAIFSRMRQFKTIKTHYHFIVDNPWETDAEKTETVEMILKAGTKRMTIFSLSLFPGTALYDRAIREGIMRPQDRQAYQKHYYTLENDFYNSCIILFLKYNLPQGLIRFLIKNKHIFPISLLGLMTKPLLYFFVFFKVLRNLMRNGYNSNIEGTFRYGKDLLKRLFIS